MNKRLKVVLFVLIGIASFIGLVIGGYYLLRNAYSATIYNVQIVDENGLPMNDITRNLISEDKNFVKLGINIQASDSQQATFFRSSNPDVAKVVYQDGQYILKYFSPGEAKITAFSQLVPEVQDSFSITVNQNFVENILLDEYYDNHFAVYADGASYSYRYYAIGANGDAEGNDEQLYDSMLLRVVGNYDTNVFKSIHINKEERKVEIQTNTVTYDSNQVFYLQAYYIDSKQEEHVINNFAYFVNAIGKRIVDVQLLLCEDRSFKGDEGYVYLNNDPYQDYLFLQYNESRVDDIVLSDKAPNIYFKIRIIYSDRDCQDISDNSSVSVNQSDSLGGLEFSGSNAIGMSCWNLKFSASDWEEGKPTMLKLQFTISYSEVIVDGQTSQISKTFDVRYIYSNTDNYKNFVDEKLYATVVEKGKEDTTLYYKYIYWDTRYLDRNPATNGKGEIIGFSGSDSEKPTPKYKMVIDKSGGFLYYIKSGKYFDRNFNEIQAPDNETKD